VENSGLKASVEMEEGSEKNDVDFGSHLGGGGQVRNDGNTKMKALDKGEGNVFGAFND